MWDFSRKRCFSPPKQISPTIIWAYKFTKRFTNFISKLLRGKNDAIEGIYYGEMCVLKIGADAFFFIVMNLGDRQTRTAERHFKDAVFVRLSK